MEAESSDRNIGRSSDCPRCEDLGYVRIDRGLVRCECQKRKVITAKLDAIPERFRQATFENYIPVDEKQIRARCRMERELTGNFFLFGPYGRGKTHLATAQYRSIVEIERPCLFFTMPELMSELRTAELDADYWCEVRHRGRYATAFHLFIDDMDKFKITDFKFEVLFELINTIYRRKLGFTVTSNLSLQQLADSGLVDASIVRRIDDICTAVEL
jgi:DNA replication protein DnaC